MSDQKEAAIKEAVESALEAYWASIASSFPSATSGDLDPGLALKLTADATAITRRWVELNVPGSAPEPLKPETRTISDVAPKWLVEVAEQVFEAYFPSADQTDVNAAMRVLARHHCIDSTIHHSGGGYLHALAIFEKETRRYFVFTYPEGVEVHTTTATDLIDAWTAATDEDLNARTKIVELI
jgi:hypothetical protein